MMNKKAVSPLIATVLLIAFTVALGAIVMNWGESFVRKTQDTASEASEGRIECTMAVDFEIINAEYRQDTTNHTNASMSILIRNAGDKEIAGFVVQVFTNMTRGGRGTYNESSLASLDVRTITVPLHITDPDCGLNESANISCSSSHITEVRVVPRIDTGALTGPVSCSNKYDSITKDKLVIRDI